MAVTTSPNLGLNLPGKGEQNWDSLINQNFDKIDNEINTNINSINSVNTQLAEKANKGKLFNFIQSIKYKATPTQIYVGGTSIMNSSLSAIWRWLDSIAKDYGDSGNWSSCFGLIGGSYDIPWNAWYKQPFGGIGYTRLKGSNVSTDIVLGYYCKKIIIRYSTEADGGSCNVLVDGVQTAVINCNGAQKYNNECVINLGALAHYTITIKAPTTGYIYLENYDVCVDNSGIQIFNATKGGSTLNEMVNLKAPITTQVSGIAINTDVGINGHFSTTSNYAPSLYVVTWTANDSGMGLANFNNTFKPTLQSIVSKVKSQRSQLMLIVEMGGAYALPTHANHATFLAIEDLMLSYANDADITVIDWHSESYYEQLGTQEWAARYYNAGIVNEATATATGDFIHPNILGYSILDKLLSIASTVKSSGRLGDGSSYDNTNYNIIGSVDNYNRNNITGLLKNIVNTNGVKCKYTCNGLAKYIYSNAVIPLYYSDDEINYEVNNNAVIQASGTSDIYGSYKVYPSNSGFYITTGHKTGAKSTITFICDGNSTIFNVHNNANTANVDNYILGKNIGKTGNTNVITPKSGLVAYSVTITDSLPYIQFTGKLYAIYSTPTDFPCIASNDSTNIKDISTPLLSIGDIISSNVNVGQTYIEIVDGKTIEKICINKRVYKVNDSNYYGLYRCQNRSITNLVRTLSLQDATTDVYNSSFGGYPQITANNPPDLQLPQGLNFLAGETYTLTGRVLGFNTLAIYLQNGGVNRFLHYNPTNNTWVEQAYNQPIAFGITTETFAVTMTMPSSIALGGVTDWSVHVRQVGGTPAQSKWGTFVLTAGSSAVI